MVNNVSTIAQKENLVSIALVIVLVRMRRLARRSMVVVLVVTVGQAKSVQNEHAMTVCGVLIVRKYANAIKTKRNCVILGPVHVFAMLDGMVQHVPDLVRILIMEKAVKIAATARTTRNVHISTVVASALLAFVA